MRVAIIPKREMTDLFNQWVDGGLEVIEPCKEAIAYVKDAPFERLLESIQLVASNVVAVMCIGELLMKYKEGKLDKKTTIKILVKFGLIAFIIFITPMFFDKYL